ncbi:MAG: branched-chain amino acid ABC transporter permease [Candidatus Tectomicrobia bacterium]|uniref:Branched-chain amino acid ABC transporter permease n=1 Tax=Tectimicrobiota bacterium TaxID=2528274 RepID=A0A932MNN7_UNCTE|nr:branched-chain amino acid ABC transporter permease [Candidatus Tectomicrobia bacterium]
MGSSSFIERRRMKYALVVLAAVAVVTPFLDDYYQTIVTRSFIFAIMAISLDILMGYTGLSSLGHGAYFAFGAYSAAILATKVPGVSIFVLFAAALGLSCLLAAFLGLLAIRAVGVYFLMITLSFAMVVWGLVYRWHTVTGGDNGIAVLNIPTFLGMPIGESTPFFFFTFGVFLCVLSVLYILVQSPFGKSLIGIREREARMKMLGYNTWLHKYLAFVISGTFAGISGMLWTLQNRFVGPTDVELVTSVEALLMVALGGPSTLVGPIFGAFIITFLRYWVSLYVERWYIILGATYIVTVLYAREGVLGKFEAIMARRRSRANSEPALPQSQKQTTESHT